MAIQYYVNKEKKTVVAILSETDMDVYNYLSKKFGKAAVTIGTTSTNFPIISNSFKSIVKCSDDDVFSEEIGKSIAKNRVLKKYYKEKDSCLKKWIEIANKNIESLR